ncbi:hypothetical protein OHC33_004793 [Knufia fluminis]|uniref:Cytochrome P450 n=1 Tax=Knufia fluminis TaxID=191047 RepID=A0AAN8EHJ8_9EURO|nr:hypothetical protein OHC33_004793 [Knufia fluminis]
MELPTVSSAALIVGTSSLVLYCVLGALYRLYFHPLAKFPGPRLAKLTGWYEFYHDIIHRGHFIWQIQKLHDEYGPIVRITPNELHIRDPDYYEEIYAAAAKKKDKWDGWVVMAGAPDSSFATVSHNLHRLRRSALNPFFSKRAIGNNEAQIKEKVEHLCRRLKECMDNDEIVRLDAAFMALTMDIITHFAFGDSYNYLDEPDFKLEWKETVIGGSANGVFLRQFPWALPILKATPLSFLNVANPKAAKLVAWQHFIRKQVNEIVVKNASGKKADGTIFQAVLDSDLPPSEKTIDRLQDEGQTLVGAGSETTAKSLAMITFFLASAPKKLQKLREEIKTIGPEPDGSFVLAKLEQLPYLTACITEGVRMMSGVTTRLPRVAHEPMKYREWEIPTGTPVSQMNYVVNNDPKIFPNPFEYHPERWIEAEEKGIRLDRYMVSFGKGSRSCVGINLAWAELYLALAYVATRFDMEVYDTTAERDVLIARDYFVGVPKEESQGIRVKIVKAL